MFLPANITLKFGDSGDFVAELQRRLANVGAYPEEQVNGFFDGTTVNGVSSFQTRCGIRADGIAGPDTLRRLNGAVSGSNSGTDNKTDSGGQEEEAKIAAANMARGLYMMDDPAAQPAPMDIHGNTAAAQGQGWGGHEAQHSPQGMTEQQLTQQQLMREAQMQQPSPDQVAQNLQQQAMMQQQMLAQQQQQVQQQLMQQQMQQQAPQPDTNPALQSMRQQMMQQQAAQHQQVQPQQQMQAAAPQAAPAAEAQPAKSLVARAMDKMDALVQKLTSYFEAKLPPDTLREVKNIGHTMLQSGVKESAVPTGPDQMRTQQLPGRGAEQAQNPQRG